MSGLIFRRPGLRPGAPAGLLSAPSLRQNRLTPSVVTSYQSDGTPVNRPRPTRGSRVSPTRLPSVASDVALWGGFIASVLFNGHSYGGGLWGGN